MKKILLSAMAVLLLAAPSVMAAPFVVSDEFTASIVDTCVITIDATEYRVDPSPTSGDLARCAVDVGDVTNGNHTMSLHTENVWGGSAPVPFDFTKELPPALSNIRLEY